MPELPTDLEGKHAELLALRHDTRNAGPPLALLSRTFCTPTELFFVRSHAATPQINHASYRFTIGGLVERPLSLSLSDLRSFPRSRVTAALQCAGLRRQELLALGPIPDELPWGPEAIGTAEWAGVPLRLLIEAVGPLPGAAHAVLLGLDSIVKGGTAIPFGASIPLAKAGADEVLLADEMNGAPLTPIHGAPLRLIVPGYIGARSVKWLDSMMLQAEPSENYFQAHAYKLFPPHIQPETVDWASGMMLGELSITAVICEPADGARIPAGRARLRGYAIAGGGRTIERVDCSSDGGATWVQAGLGQREQWAWRLWEADLDLAPGAHRLVVRAWDSAANTQPEHYTTVWNFKGYMNNAWHRIDITAE